tara:strand:+ start:181 stop:666 length:486 start_codon:yes stop_codon:yes gene_type:complete
MSNARTLASTINSSSEIVVPSGGIAFKDLDSSNDSDTGSESYVLGQDGYETGTWTPSAVAGSISGTSITYTGKYTLVGNKLTLYMRAFSASGDIQVSSYVSFSGVPFSITNPGTSTVITEDIDANSRHGFSLLGVSSRVSFSPCGSSGGTNQLLTTITTII